MTRLSVIGLTGMPGAGKGEAKKILGELIAKYPRRINVGSKEQWLLSFSTPLRETLSQYGIPITRENLQLLAQMLDELRGNQGSLTHAVDNRIMQALYHPSIGGANRLVVVDGVRWPTDEQMIRESLPHRKGMIIYIQADQEIRYQRTLARAENEGDAVKTWEQFCSEDAAENEKYIDEIGGRADYTIENNGTYEEFREKIEQLFYEKIEVLF